jgi:hypothetical protein
MYCVDKLFSIESRKKAFGVAYLNAVKENSSPEALKAIVDEALADTEKIQKEIDVLQAEIDRVNNVTKDKIVAAKPGKGAATTAATTGATTTAAAAVAPETAAAPTPATPAPATPAPVAPVTPAPAVAPATPPTAPATPDAEPAPETTTPAPVAVAAPAPAPETTAATDLTPSEKQDMEEVNLTSTTPEGTK